MLANFSFVVVACIAGLASVSSLPVQALTSGVPAAGLPSADTYSSTVLPEKAGIVSWRTLAAVESVPKGVRLVTKFSDEILSLDGKEVKLQGFMIPLSTSERQGRFLISAVPPDCAFCLPAGPEALVEVVAKGPVKFGGEPIVVVGKFAVLKDDDGGLLYRLADAEVLGSAVSAPAAKPSK